MRSSADRTDRASSVACARRWSPEALRRIERTEPHRWPAPGAGRQRLFGGYNGQSLIGGLRQALVASRNRFGLRSAELHALIGLLVETHQAFRPAVPVDIFLVSLDEESDE